jgi:hypothetical protein
MKIKYCNLVLTLILSIASSSVDAINVGASTVTAKNNNISISWNAPANGVYKVFVFVGNKATANHVLYWVYPKGKSNNLICSSTDATYPCFEIAINQATNTGKWVQLTLNNGDANTAWEFIGQKSAVVTNKNMNASEILDVGGVKFQIIRYRKIANDGSLLNDSATLGNKAKDWACVRDNLTGLIWELKTTDGGLRDVNKEFSWYDPNPITNGGFEGYKSQNGFSDTYTYTNTINSQKLCGFNDWRVPHIGELLKLVDENGMINRNYFPNLSDIVYWSSVTTEYDSTKAWIMLFFLGEKSDASKNLDVGSVQLVRGR